MSTGQYDPDPRQQSTDPRIAQIQGVSSKLECPSQNLNLLDRSTRIP